jgi:hypothetical protein
MSLEAQDRLDKAPDLCYYGAGRDRGGHAAQIWPHNVDLSAFAGKHDSSRSTIDLGTALGPGEQAYGLQLLAPPSGSRKREGACG